MHKEAYDKAPVKKTHVYEWPKHFVMAVQVSIVIHAVDNHQLKQMSKH
jgi:hypothetical protein